MKRRSQWICCHVRTSNHFQHGVITTTPSPPPSAWLLGGAGIVTSQQLELPSSACLESHDQSHHKSHTQNTPQSTGTPWAHLCWIHYLINMATVAVLWSELFPVHWPYMIVNTFVDDKRVTPFLDSLGNYHWGKKCEECRNCYKAKSFVVGATRSKNNKQDCQTSTSTTQTYKGFTQGFLLEVVVSQ